MAFGDYWSDFLSAVESQKFESVLYESVGDQDLAFFAHRDGLLLRVDSSGRGELRAVNDCTVYCFCLLTVPAAILFGNSQPFKGSRAVWAFDARTTSQLLKRLCDLRRGGVFLNPWPDRVVMYLTCAADSDGGASSPRLREIAKERIERMPDWVQVMVHGGSSVKIR